AARQELARHLQMVDGRHGDDDGVDLPEEPVNLGEGVSGGACDGRRGALPDPIDRAGERHPRERGENARVVTSEMADADDADAHGLRNRCGAHGRSLPTTTIPAASAARMNASP